MDNETNETDALIRTLAALNGIPLNDEMMPQTRVNFEIAARMAKTLLDFPLEDSEEPGPVFRS